MDFQVNTSDLEEIAGVFSGAGSDVVHLRAVLASQAAGPEAADVIGSGGAASKYADVFGQWTHALDQLASSLDTMSRKMRAVAAAYAQTEAANTAPTGP
jgi:WXG100 family type VII secretion target